LNVGTFLIAPYADITLETRLSAKKKGGTNLGEQPEKPEAIVY
jgi:hypothetical protein